MRQKILLIEDDTPDAIVVQEHLDKQGYEVEIVEDGETALATMRNSQPDMVLVDLMLPGMSGLDVCKEIRKKSNVALIMLSAKADETDRVCGLELGADDYITKPVSLRELVVRVRAVMRRAKTRSLDDSPLLFQGGDVVLDVAKRRVTVRGTSVYLPMKEFDLLRVLMSRNGEVIEYDKLYAEVWGQEATPTARRALHVHIRWLREKVEENPSRPKYVRVLHTVGYQFVTDDD